MLHTLKFQVKINRMISKLLVMIIYRDKMQGSYIELKNSKKKIEECLIRLGKWNTMSLMN